jgi:hypothetical protein
MQIYFLKHIGECFCLFWREIFGSAFGGTFARLEEGSELRKKYNSQENFSAQLRYKSEENIAGSG